MFFRFGCAVFLVVLVSAAGVVLETENLALRRALSHQNYQMEILRDTYARLRLKTQQMGAPERLMQAIDAAQLTLPEHTGRHEPSASGGTAFRTDLSLER